MKQFKQYITETILAADVEPHAQEAVNLLKTELAKVLGPRYVVKSHYSNSLGKSVHLRIVDTKPVNGIDHNSPVFMQFMLFLSSNSGKNIDLPKISWEMSQGPRSVPYRKISSSVSIQDATKKLIDWFKKSKPALDGLLGESNKFDLNLANKIVKSISIGKPFTHFSDVDDIEYKTSKVTKVEIDPDDNSVVVHGDIITIDSINNKTKQKSFNIWPSKDIIK